MSERNITLFSDVVLLTCVVESGRGEDVVKAARGVGAGGALIHSERGVGLRERLGIFGLAIDAEKEVVNMLIGSEQAELVGTTIFRAAELDRPGAGFLYLTPLDAVATYVPKSVRDRLDARNR